MHFLQAISSDLSVLIVCNKAGGTIKGDIKKNCKLVISTSHAAYFGSWVWVSRIATVCSGVAYIRSYYAFNVLSEVSSLPCIFTFHFLQLDKQINRFCT